MNLSIHALKDEPLLLKDVQKTLVIIYLRIQCSGLPQPFFKLMHEIDIVAHSCKQFGSSGFAQFNSLCGVFRNTRVQQI